MKKLTLDSYESSILQDIENDEFSSVNHLADEIEEARTMVISIVHTYAQGKLKDES